MRTAGLPADYTPLAAAALKTLEEMAGDVLTGLGKSLPGVSYGDPRAIKALSDDLDRNRQTYLADESIKGRIWWLYSAFLGKAIIENAQGSTCIWVEAEGDNYCLKITTPKGEEVMAAPFTRVAKQLIDGPEYSMLAYYVAIDNVLRNGMPTRARGPGAA